MSMNFYSRSPGSRSALICQSQSVGGSKFAFRAQFDRFDSCLPFKMPEPGESAIPSSRLVIRFRVRLKKQQKPVEDDVPKQESPISSEKQHEKKLLRQRGDLRKRCLEDYRKIMDTIEASENFLKRAQQERVRSPVEEEELLCSSLPPSSLRTMSTELGAPLLKTKRPKRKKILVPTVKPPSDRTRKLLTSAPQSSSTSDYNKTPPKPKSPSTFLVTDKKDPSRQHYEYHAVPWNSSSAQENSKKSQNVAKTRPPPATQPKTTTTSESSMTKITSSCASCCCCCSAKSCCFRSSTTPGVCSGVLSVSGVSSKPTILKLDKSAPLPAAVIASPNRSVPPAASPSSALSTVSTVLCSPFEWASYHRVKKLRDPLRKLLAKLSSSTTSEEKTQVTQKDTSIELRSQRSKAKSPSSLVNYSLSSSVSDSSSLDSSSQSGSSYSTSLTTSSGSSGSSGTTDSSTYSESSGSSGSSAPLNKPSPSGPATLDASTAQAISSAEKEHLSNLRGRLCLGFHGSSDHHVAEVAQGVQERSLKLDLMNIFIYLLRVCVIRMFM
ncbi:hypothetical protein L596_028278 [Steinernema carpocapsae]|uniref:Uncharacterized protein n=1 Tax=Steinernema carpocapsae TaxID=34508 RepID=A0A4V5ZXU4_STECR|nr:hypothetical protein L596_028278 [Steinernema carpocapsae]